jgi:hypothetical protein
LGRALGRCDDSTALPNTSRIMNAPSQRLETGDTIIGGGNDDLRRTDCLSGQISILGAGRAPMCEYQFRERLRSGAIGDGRVQRGTMAHHLATSRAASSPITEAVGGS